MINISINIRKSMTIGIVKSTYKQFGLSRPSFNNAPGWGSNNWRAGLPDTWQYGGENTEQQSHVVLTPELQYLWYNECVKLWPGKVKDDYDRSFNSLTADDRWQTNQYGSTTCAVYPTGKNIDSEPMRYFTLLTGNAAIEIIGAPKKVYNKLSWPFKVIDASKPVNNISYETHPYQFYKPMNSIRTPIFDSNGVWTGKYEENGYQAFPQFNGNSITPLFMPNTDIAWIDVNYVDVLRPGECIPYPFNM